MGNFFRKWLRRTDGVTAVEFSLIGVPFVLMTIGTIETALMFTAHSLLQESTFTAARLVRTGQVQQAEDDPEEMFREAVCDFADALIPCNQIQFQVKSVPSFEAADDEPPEFDEDGNMQDTEFDPGVANSVVLIRVAYSYPIKTPLMQSFFSNVGSNKRTLLSTIVLQTEPYQ